LAGLLVRTGFETLYPEMGGRELAIAEHVLLSEIPVLLMAGRLV
jgi:hypothetical protein